MVAGEWPPTAGVGRLDLTTVAAPESESDLAFILCTLESHQIPFFVQGNGFGGLFPGPQINGYNSRRVLVPSGFAEQAAQALANASVVTVADIESTTLPPGNGVLAKLRLVFEVAFLGWFVPRSSREPPEGRT